MTKSFHLRRLSVLPRATREILGSEMKYLLFTILNLLLPISIPSLILEQLCSS